MSMEVAREVVEEVKGEEDAQVHMMMMMMITMRIMVKVNDHDNDLCSKDTRPRRSLNLATITSCHYVVKIFV